MSEEFLLDKLRSVVHGYLNDRVSKPAMETVTQNVVGQARIANLGMLTRIMIGDAYSHGIDYDKDFLSSLPTEQVEARLKVLRAFVGSADDANPPELDVVRDAAQYLASDNSRKFLLAYLQRELAWIVVSVLSASYVSALVLMRSVFQLIVGLATVTTGGMRARIADVICLDAVERKRVAKLWRRLCAWSHPYGRWVKEVCPGYSGQSPMYHPRLFALCLDEMTELVDFFAAVVVSKYDLDRKRILAELGKDHVDLAGLPSLSRSLGVEPPNPPE